ncbi:MAG: phosphatidylglycerophosphatase A [Candidatus Omnitrophica bacterium]|nr:phosphatidylglycerophosphatase A [Candidatus Omnitrophota bacterium]MDD5487919.1 phosphatidylglycerophosphatase A [Candidatus Omnitrophota bacterium]
MNLDKLCDRIATIMGLGRLPYAPGTWGSVAGLAAVLLVSGHIFLYLTVMISSSILGIIVSGRIADITGENDPSFVVIDEFVGIFFVFLFMPINVATVITGFILFRLLDIFKPFPIRKIEQIPGGWGIMADDIAAGLIANLLLRALLHTYLLYR